MASHISERHVEGAPEASYFYAHQADIAELLSVVGLPPEASQDIKTSVKLTQPWVQEHVGGMPIAHFTPEEHTHLEQIYDRLKHVQARPILPGHYHTVLAMGSMLAGANRRYAFIADALQNPDVTVDSITMLSGQRPLNEEIEKAPAEFLLDAVQATGNGGAWHANLEGTHSITWETDIVRLAALRNLGALPLKRLELRLGHSDPIKRYEFDLRGTPVHLLHGLAVERPIGPPRPTTASTINDWLKQDNPPEGARIAFVAANPHIDRMTVTARDVLKEAGRDDIELVPCGPAAIEGSSHKIYLGEVARSIYEASLGQ